MVTIDNDSIYSSETFQAFFKHLQYSLVIKAIAPEFKVLAVSDHYLRLAHQQREDVIGRRLFEVFPGSDSDVSEQFSLYSSLGRVMANGKQDLLPVFKYELYLPQKGKNEAYYCSVINDPIKNAAGEVEYIIITTANITSKIMQEESPVNVLQQTAFEREQILNIELAATNDQLIRMQQDMALLNSELEERIAQRTSSLSESEARFRNMAENAAVLIALSDDKGRYTYFNKAWTSLTGLPLEKLLKPNWVNILHPFDQDRFINTVKQASKQLKPWKMEFRVVNRNGNNCWLMGSGAVRYATDGSFAGYISSCIDITETKNQQAELEILNAQLIAAYKEQSESNGKLAEVNDQLLKIQHVLVSKNEQLAKSEENLVAINKRLAESKQVLQMAILSNDMGTWQADLNTGLFTSSEKSQQIHGLSDGKILGIKKVLAMVDRGHQQRLVACIEQAMANHSTFIIEYMLHPKNNKDAKWIRMSGVVRLDEANQPISLLGTLLDISEQKQDEVRKNDFIGMVSHELKTPITSIKAYVQILQARSQQSDDAFSINLLDKTNQQIGKMIRMINGFLNVSRLESAKIQIDYQRFDLAKLIKEAEEEALAFITSHQVLFSPVAEIFVNADRDKLGQVITNLISNAVKYSPVGSVIHVACITQNGHALVSVKDQGIGISKEDVPKLFERYYRVKSQTNNIGGFGIGLYLCDEIIKQLDGKLWVESEIGKGSTFYFTVPLA